MQPLRHGDPAAIGPYHLIARLGEGGMGEVYLGRSRGGIVLAVKVVHSDLAERTGFRERFAHEIAAARAVGGAFTAAVVDAGEVPRPWMATVFLPGVTLSKAVTDHGPLPPAAARVLGAGIAEALRSIHRAGIVHRDLKPSNIILTSDGPRVVDFGIARAEDRDTVTESGALIGSLAYMAPEQLFGRPTSPATDVYALGGVLVYCTTGAPPFGDVPGGAPGVLHRITAGTPDLGSMTDDQLRALITSCLAEDPEQRPTPEELIDKLLPADERDAHGADLVVVHPPDEWMPEPLTTSIDEQTTRLRAALGKPTRLTTHAHPAATEKRAKPHTLPLPRNMAPVRPASDPNRRRILRALLATTCLAAAGGYAAWWTTRPDDREFPDALWTVELPVSSIRLVAGGRIFVTSVRSRTLHCLDAGTGREIWQRQETGVQTPAEYLTATLALDDVLVTRSLTSVSVYDIHTGALRWTAPSQPRTKRPLIAANDTFVFDVGEGTALSDAPPALYAYYRGGSIAWRREVTWRGARYVVVTGGPLLVADKVVVTGTTGIGAQCFAAAYDAATGAPLWVREYPGEEDPANPVAPTPDTVYVTNGTYTVHALDAATGTPRWSAPPDFSPDARGPRQETLHHHQDGAGPLVADGIVFVGGDDRLLRAYDAATGSRLWELPVDVADDPGDSFLPVVDGGIAFVQDHREMTAIGARDGRIRWRAPVRPPDTPPARPLLVDGLLHTLHWPPPDDYVEIHTYAPSDGTLVRTLHAPVDGVTGLAADQHALFTLWSDGRDKLTAFAPSPASSSAAPESVASSGLR